MAVRLEEIVARNPIGEAAKTHPTEEQVVQTLLDILERTTLCSLASVTSTGRAHVNAAYFAYTEDLDLYFLSHPGAQHSENIERNPSAAVSAFRTDQTWGGQDRGVQLFGRVRRASGREAEVAASVYSERFPLYRRWLKPRTSPGRKIAAQLLTYSFYRFRPSRIKVFDEEAFGEASFVSASVRSWK